MGMVRKSILLCLVWAGLAWGQNRSLVQPFAGGCAVWTQQRVNIYRLPDTTNVYRFDTTDAYGVWETYLPLAGQYRAKLAGTQNTWVERFNHIPVVGIGGDSTSNAGRLIQNALDSLPSTGGVIHLPPGTHLIDSTTITVNKSNVTIQGTGDNCILKVANSLNAYAFTVANSTVNVTFEDFAINGNKANQTAGGGFNVNGSGIKNIKWHRVHIRHTYDHGIVLANGVTDFDIENSTIDSIGPAGQTSATAAIPVYIVTSVTDGRLKFNNFNWWSGVAAVRINNNCRRIFLTGNKYLSNDRTGSADRRAVFAGAATNDSCRDIHLKDEYAFNIDENGFYINFADSTSYDHCIADSCGNNGFEINGNSFSINACQSRRNTNDGFAVNNGKGGVISNSISELNGHRGIYVFAATGDSATDISLMGNPCRANSQTTDTTWAGIEVGAAGTGKCRRITVIGNPCGDAVAAPRQRFGIQTTNDVDYYTIVGNIVTPKGSGAASGLNDGGTGANKYVPAGGNP